MSKVITAKYDAKQNMLRLDEPLEGVRDHEMVLVIVSQEENDAILAEETGEER